MDESANRQSEENSKAKEPEVLTRELLELYVFTFSRSLFYDIYILLLLICCLTINLWLQTRPVVKRSSAAGSLDKPAKTDPAKEDDKPIKNVGRASGSSSSDICVYIYKLSTYP